MKKNRSFIVINVMYALIFLGMMINIVWFMLFHSQEAITNSYNNKRLDVLAAQNYRGTIYAASGEILAETMLDVSGNEIRKYPYGDLFAHAVGYASNGGAGIEAM
ncbi:MAG TPA: penicillin-binding protein 2, partial [Lachnospiraceae bacterium]|nr:penicillin-binding protein 2 [Lachnospiraceae bacterium]